jgi:para-nitrobenzyl esterase
MKKRDAVAALVVAAAGLFTVSSSEVGTQTPSCLVNTTSGAVQGVDLGASCGFLGIPFAAPPVGDLRWKPPQPAAAWAPATLNATAPPSTCAQLIAPAFTVVTGSEDCLKLNIWTPDPLPATPTAVIVWIHTGAFQGASANLADSNPRNLVERTGAIVVAANYRLGPLGFMGHPALTAEDQAYPSSGNYGLLDQRAALAWVRDHIAAFGGDPSNVTIDGQSAGGHSVSFHVVSPRSAGYFHGAIMQSGYASSRLPTLADAESLGTSFATAAGCTDPSQVLACMRSTTINQVLLGFGRGQQEFAETGRIPWGPVVDGLEIPDQPRRLYERGVFNHVPVIVGATRDEGWIYVDRSFPAGLAEEQYEAQVAKEFGATEAPTLLAMYPAASFPSPKHALARMTGDAEAVCEARRIARLIARTRTPVYLYSFEREVDAVAPDLVIHGLDRNFVFGNNYGPPSNYVFNSDDLALFGAISSYWTQFAVAGKPNSHHSDLPRWPAFRHPNGRESGSGRYLVLDWPLREGQGLGGSACDYWEEFFLNSISASTPAGYPSNNLCGVTIIDDVKLDHDVSCPGDGLRVGADGVRIDLNGHTIAGSGGGVGIGVTGRHNVSIVGGTVNNFEAGVRLVDSTGVVIKRNTFQENNDGVDLQSGSWLNTVRENQFLNNRSRGIMIRSDTVDNLVKENSFGGNRVGILLFGPVGTTVSGNVVNASGLAGIRVNVLATDNLVKENWITSNPAGVEFLVTPTGSTIGNSVVHNAIQSNACGVKGPVEGNTVKRNFLDGNTTDSCQ